MTVLEPGRDALKLADLVKASGLNIRVQHARTNGRDCLHVTKEDRTGTKQGFPRLSYTIYTEAEWDSHPWNREARKRDKKENKDILAAVANKEAQ